MAPEKSNAEQEQDERIRRVLENAGAVFNSWPKWKQEEVRAELERRE